MERKLKSYESFRNGNDQKLNEEILLKLFNWLKNQFKKAAEKINKIAGDYEEFKKFRKAQLLNPNDAGGFFSEIFKEYNAKPTFTDQDAFQMVQRMIDPDDSVLSQKSIAELLVNIPDATEKKLVAWQFETIRNKTLFELKYGGEAAKNFVAGKPLPTPAIDPKKISGEEVTRYTTGPNVGKFIKETHLPGLKAKLKASTDGAVIKKETITYVKDVVIKTLIKYSDQITEEAYNAATGNKGGTTEEKIKSYGVTKAEELVGKEIYYKRDGFDDKAPSKDKVAKNTVKAYDQEKGFTIQGAEGEFNKELDKLLSKEEGEKIMGVAGAKEGEPMNYEKLNDIYDKQQEVIFLLPGVEMDKYDPKKSPEEQKEVVGFAKMTALNDQNNEESVTIKYDDKDIKMAYDRVIGPLGEEQASEEAENAKKELAEIKDDPEKMKKVASYADFLKRGDKDQVKTLNDLLEDEIAKLPKK